MKFRDVTIKVPCIVLGVYAASRRCGAGAARTGLAAARAETRRLSCAVSRIPPATVQRGTDYTHLNIFLPNTRVLTFAVAVPKLLQFYL